MSRGKITAQPLAGGHHLCQRQARVCGGWRGVGGREREKKICPDSLGLSGAEMLMFLTVNCRNLQESKQRSRSKKLCKKQIVFFMNIK